MTIPLYARILDAITAENHNWRTVTVVRVPTGTELPYMPSNLRVVYDDNVDGFALESRPTFPESEP